MKKVDGFVITPEVEAHIRSSVPKLEEMGVEVAEMGFIHAQGCYVGAHPVTEGEGEFYVKFNLTEGEKTLTFIHATAEVETLPYDLEFVLS